MQQGIKFQEYDAACQSLAGAESDQHMILQNQAQLLALQPQNSPHFLYNTLSAIQGMACQKRLRKSAPPSPPSPT